MGSYIAYVGKVRIKPEQVDIFRRIFEGKAFELLDIDTEMSKRIYNWFLGCFSSDYPPIFLWRKNNWKESWYNKYKTELSDDGVFTYGVSTKNYGYWLNEFFNEILPYFTDKVVECDYYNSWEDYNENEDLSDELFTDTYSDEYIEKQSLWNKFKDNHVAFLTNNKFIFKDIVLRLESKTELFEYRAIRKWQNGCIDVIAEYSLMDDERTTAIETIDIKSLLKVHNINSESILSEIIGIILQ